MLTRDYPFPVREPVRGKPNIITTDLDVQIDTNVMNADGTMKGGSGRGNSRGNRRGKRQAHPSASFRWIIDGEKVVPYQIADEYSK